MATADSVKAKLQGLIAKANEVTGNTDTDLTTVVHALMAGFGQGGGSGFNFKVVDGVSAPTSPSENTIWMNTDQKITGWYLSHTEPAEPSDGMAWICLASCADTEFNALKENGIQIFPINGYQYINDVWEKKTIECYQNGGWVEFAKTILFQGGNQNIPLTGGWKAANAGITFTIGDEIVGAITGSPRDGAIYTQNVINITEFSSLKCKVNKDSGIFNFGLTAANTSYAPAMTVKTTSRVSGEQEVMVDLSNMSGAYYIAIHFDVCEGSISSVWLER